MLIRMLLAVESEALRRRLERLVTQEGVLLVRASGKEGIWRRLTAEDIDLVMVDRASLPNAPGEFISSIRKLPDRPEIVVIVDREDPEERAALVAAGCLAVLSEHVTDGALGDTLRALVERRREDAVGRLKADRPEERFSLNDFVFVSPAMQRFMTLARRVVTTDTSLLILGETGVGKERLARAIHAESPRSSGPFMAVNCGALPESLLESELFGHEKGAFTGAIRARRGYFELAHGGTLFLDEIGDIPLHLQVKLLRVLEDRRIVRVGGEKPVRVDVRVMAATNRDLEADQAAKRFRADLYYRLAVVTLTLPPLRERREDIPVLVEAYFQRFRALLGRPVLGLRPEVMGALVRYSWPGNVRELINVVERAVLLCSGAEVELSDLPRRISGLDADAALPNGTDPAARPSRPLPHRLLEKPLRQARADVVGTFERSYLVGLLEETRGRIGETARRAGINPRSLYGLMRRYELKKESFKAPNRV